MELSNERILEVIRGAKRPATLTRIARTIGATEPETALALVELHRAKRVKLVTSGMNVAYRIANTKGPADGTP